MPSVHVVVPCYNYARYLEACVGSVLAQPEVDVSVLVIDDCSSDETPRVAAALAARDSRVAWRRHAVNRGHIATYNEGLGEARSDYVVLLSADDLLVPGSLQRAVALMQARPSVGLVYGYAVPVAGDPLPAARQRARAPTVWPGHHWLRLMCRAGRNFITCPEVVMRTSVQHRIGGYRPSLPHTGDMEMWMRAAAVADVARINGADQAFYRVHPRSMQRTVHAGKLVDLRGRLAAYESALGEPVPELAAEAPALLDAARARLAGEALEEACRAFDRALVGAEPVEAYVAFARETWPQAHALPQWAALERRRRVAAQSAPYYPPFLVDALLRRARHELRSARWRRDGVV